MHGAAEQIGALVVSRDGNSIEGIVSERDLAYGLATYGGRLPMIPISELMTKAVAVCSPEDSVTDVMKLMTRRRIRHVPVKDGDQLVGIISIGDVLKHRLGELEIAGIIEQEVDGLPVELRSRRLDARGVGDIQRNNLEFVVARVSQSAQL